MSTRLFVGVDIGTRIHVGATTEPDARRAQISRRRTERYMSLLASMNRWAEEPR